MGPRHGGGGFGPGGPASPHGGVGGGFRHPGSSSSGPVDRSAGAIGGGHGRWGREYSAPGVGGSSARHGGGAAASFSHGGGAGLTRHQDGVGVAHQGRARFGTPGFRGGPGRAQPRFDRRYYPAAISAQTRFHWVGGWSRQPDYYYRRWGYGDYLPFGWYGRPFWILDYWLYDLPIAPFDYVWVRVGPDALLVDEYTGEVVEVIYGLFW